MIEVLSNVPHYPYWGLLIVSYFYFTGIAAGSCSYCTAYTLMGQKHLKPLAFWAAIIALIAYMVPPSVLIADLDQPLRFYYLYFFYNFTSVFTWGTMVLTVFPVIMSLYAYMLWNEDKFHEAGKYQNLKKAVSALAVPTYVTVHAYTGFVFGVVVSRSYWQSAVMPAYFLAGAVVSGFSVMLIVAILKRRIELRHPGSAVSRFGLVSDELIMTVKKVLGWSLLTYTFFIIPQLIMLLYNNEMGRLAGFNVIHEKIFILGDVVMGLLAPIFILMHPATRKSYPWLFLAALLVLIGVWLNRYTVVNIGQLIPLS